MDVEQPALYEILVPTVRPNTEGQKFFTTRFHRVWDAKVRAITGGLTIAPPNRGQWVSGDAVFIERMIPVQIMATHEQMVQVVAMTLDYYEQEAVMWYVVSNEVWITRHPTRKNKS